MMHAFKWLKASDFSNRFKPYHCIQTKCNNHPLRLIKSLKKRKIGANKEIVDLSLLKMLFSFRLIKSHQNG